MPAPPPVQPGEIIAEKYRVERILGSGGMGVVVAATHTQLGHRVALKFLRQEAIERGAPVERFLREARAAARIQSEHVAKVLDVGTLATGAPYMVMEFLQGEDLEQRLARQGVLSDTQAAGYVLEALEALAEAHAAGIVHRDIKPANLFLASTPAGERVKVLDFGISKAPLEDAQRKLTEDAVMVGTPAYMSPEQVRSSSHVDLRSDIWSMGVVLHELVTGDLPFPGASFAALIATILTGPPNRAGKGARSRLQPIIDRCLEKDPDQRYADVGELARALVAFGPPRCEVSLERISAVLGPSTGTSARTSDLRAYLATAELPVQPTKPFLLRPRSSRLWVPLVAFGIGGVFALVLGLSPAMRARRAHGTTDAADARGATTAAASSADATSDPVASSTAVAVTTASASSIAPAREPSVTASAAASTVTPDPTSVPAAPSGAHAARSLVRAPPPAPPTPPAPPSNGRPCKLTQYRDADGFTHFREVCP